MLLLQPSVRRGIAFALRRGRLHDDRRRHFWREQARAEAGGRGHGVGIRRGGGFAVHGATHPPQVPRRPARCHGRPSSRAPGPPVRVSELLGAMSLRVLERLELAEWTVRHLRWQDIVGNHVLWRNAAAQVVPPWRDDAKNDEHEQQFWDHMYGDMWLPVSECRHRPEDELRAALAEYERQIPLLKKSVQQTDATLRKYGL